MTTKTAIWNALDRMGFVWTVEVDELVDWEIRTMDGKDTARQAAARVARKARQAV
jgi:hypothetical protein